MVEPASQTAQVVEPISASGPTVLPLFQSLMNGEGAAGIAVFGSVFGIVSTIWTWYVVAAYVISIILLTIYVYASIRYKELGDIFDEMISKSEAAYQRAHGGVSANARWQELQGHIDSENPNDWKLAIIEADIMLDDALKRLGYAGVSLGERLRGMSPANLQTLDDAWQAHKVRNDIAHAGADFILTHRMARDTIGRYQRVFEELEVV